MNETPAQDRRIVPRWRDFKTTGELRELEGTGSATKRELETEDREFKEKLHRWTSEHNAPSATELVGLALLFRREAEARDAAEFLLSDGSDARELSKRLAQHVLGHRSAMFETQLPAREMVKRLRRRLRDQPRNPVAWVELSRQHAILGDHAKARSAMRSAVGLVDSNRYVLRSAVRLFVHLDEFDEALHVLRGRDATPFDPWLLSAEIATSSVAGQSSRLVKRARNILGDQAHDARQTSELASALATLDLIHGSHTAARKLFRRSLLDATDNSVAQASWASRRLQRLDLSEDNLAGPRSFEARALELASKSEWGHALDQCQDWFTDEPYSTRAAIYGSYLASTTVQDFTLAERFARNGLNANPKDPVLLNNLAVALACQGRVDEARKTLSSIDQSSLSGDQRMVGLATEGLINFRQGNLAEGRSRYEAALELAKRESSSLHVLALMHYLREELLAGAVSSEILKRVPREDQLDGKPETIAFRQKLQLMADERSRAGRSK